MGWRDYHDVQGSKAEDGPVSAAQDKYSLCPGIRKYNFGTFLTCYLGG
jgi:hypothetical protein